VNPKVTLLESVIIVVYMAAVCFTLVDLGHVSHLAAFLNVIPLVDVWSINLEDPGLIVQTQMVQCR
jgi:hypothetical protein